MRISNYTFPKQTFWRKYEVASVCALYRALNYLREHLSDPITNEDVARALNFHSYYLNRIVRQQTGQSLHQHLLSSRLNYAQRLLLNTDLSVEAVALLSGFQNAAHFSARFHRWFGVPPSVVRKNFCI